VRTASRCIPTGSAATSSGGPPRRAPRIRFYDLRHTHATPSGAADRCASQGHQRAAGERHCGDDLDIYSHAIPPCSTTPRPPRPARARQTGGGRAATAVVVASGRSPTRATCWRGRNLVANAGQALYGRRAAGPLSCGFGGAPRGTRTPNRQIRSLPGIVRLLVCGPSVLLTSKNLVLPVRLFLCGPPISLLYSVKNSVNDGLLEGEHQICVWCLNDRSSTQSAGFESVGPTGPRFFGSHHALWRCTRGPWPSTASCATRPGRPARQHRRTRPARTLAGATTRRLDPEPNAATFGLSAKPARESCPPLHLPQRP
jgi:hypothetical protein